MTGTPLSFSLSLSLSLSLDENVLSVTCTHSQVHIYCHVCSIKIPAKKTTPRNAGRGGHVVVVVVVIGCSASTTYRLFFLWRDGFETTV